jgi:hypothetical protein
LLESMLSQELFEPSLKKIVKNRLGKA